MQCSNINFDDLPTSISEFFTAEQFAEISEYEKQHLSNLRQNFEALRRAGLPVTPPEFMLRNRSEKERQKLVTPAVIESSDGSDSEWTPALEVPKRPQVNQRKRLFEPPKKASTKDNTKEKVQSPTKWKKRRKKQTDSDDDEVDEVHVYPFRKMRMSSYMSLATLDDDDFLYCEECRQEYDEDCPVHGPLMCVNDTEVPLTCLSESDEYSKRTLPEGLVIKKSKIANAGLGVFAIKDFPARARFGPYRGKKEVIETIAHESGYSWQIMKDGQTSHFVDGKDPSISNWMRYVNCARHEDEQCVTAYQYQGEIYYRSHKPIFAGAEILVYYGDSYAKDLEIHIPKFGRKLQRSNLQESVTTENDGVFSCTECHLSFNHTWYLQRHVKYRHHNKYLELNYSKLNTDILLEEKRIANDESKQGKVDVNTKLNDSIDTNLDGGTLSESIKIHPVNTFSVSKANISYHLSSENENYTDQEINKLCVSNICTNLTRGDESHTQCQNVKSNINEHPGKKYYKCDVCYVGFTHSASLKQHKRIHTGEKPYKCDVCNVGFTQSASLKQHKRIHTGEKPYKCDVCNVGFTHSASLKQHKRIHTGEKPYKCDVCNVGFTQSGHLKQHKRIHTGEKPYKCDVCNVGFTHSASLKRHKRIHTGEKPYKCDVCNVGFTQSASLKQHKRIHTGEKPYKCDVCNVGFTYSGSLKQHKRIHT